MSKFINIFHVLSYFPTEFRLLFLFICIYIYIILLYFLFSIKLKKFVESFRWNAEKFRFSQNFTKSFDSFLVVFRLNSDNILLNVEVCLQFSMFFLHFPILENSVWIRNSTKFSMLLIIFRLNSGRIPIISGYIKISVD